MQALVLLSVCALVGRAAERQEKRGTRQERLLNVFNIVRFPNDGCTSSLGTFGVCYTASECQSRGGSSGGSCASGFGVCCTFQGSCGGSTSVNNTYFASDTSDTSPCIFSVCKASSDICQIRLGFDSFTIAQPSTNKPGDANPNGRTQCQKAQFSANSAGPAAPTICGSNSGYHMILEARDDCNKLSFTWTSTDTRTWNIHVMQIACSDSWKPPEGCLQFYTGSTGTVASYNYQGGYHLASQRYTACIRAEQGKCSIAYANDGTVSTFSISGTISTGSSGVGDSCTLDFVLLAGGGATAGASTNYDRYCGGLLAATNAATTATTVYTNKLPFQIGVHTDGTEVDITSPATAYELSAGFSLYYSQVDC